MIPASPPADAAWVVIDTPLAPQALAVFCRDLERLYRINPYLEFHAWTRIGNGSVHAVFRNLSNRREYDVKMRVEYRSVFDFTVYYDHGIRRSTRFEIEAALGGSRLGITDDYTSTAPGTAPDPDQADKSLRAWGVALKTYLERENRWGKSAIWRWYMRRVWLPMRPAARRIAFVITMVTLAEIALFALVMAIYWIENRP
ncbi:MAG: hypothetical protein ACK4N4_01505 [Burkholderiales bacterium]